MGPNFIRTRLCIVPNFTRTRLCIVPKFYSDSSLHRSKFYSDSSQHRSDFLSDACRRTQEIEAESKLLDSKSFQLLIGINTYSLLSVSFQVLTGCILKERVKHKIA
eukprot:4407884-Amphidinium_carterae.1